MVEEGTAFLAFSLLKVLAFSTTIDMRSSAQHASWGIIGARVYIVMRSRDAACNCGRGRIMIEARRSQSAEAATREMAVVVGLSLRPCVGSAPKSSSSRVVHRFRVRMA